MSTNHDTLPWGLFAAELFLVQNWRWDCIELSDDEQRRQLVERFLQTSPVPESCLPKLNRDGNAPVLSEKQQPSPREIEVVLQPWRSSHLRRTAYELTEGGRSELIILRTDYSGGAAHDDTLKGWLQEEQDSDPFYEEEDEEWRVLDDASMFAFSDDNWLSRLLYLLPELGGRPTHGNSSGEGRRLNRSLSHGDFDFIDDEVDPIAEAQYRAFCYTSIQPLVLADKQAFNSDRPLLVFLDGFGNIVRSARCPAEVLGWEKTFHRQGKSRGYAWKDGDLGPAYCEDGQVGRVLYPRVREVVSASSRE